MDSGLSYFCRPSYINLIIMKKFRTVIIVIIILFAFNEILDYQNEKTREILKQERIKAEKRLEKSKDTIPLVPLVPAKKIDSL